MYDRTTLARRILLAAVLGGLVSAAAPASDRGAVGGAVDGTVLDESGKPLQGALITASVKVSEGIRSVTGFSDSQGRFALPAARLGAQSPSISVQKLGFAESKRSRTGEQLQIVMAPTPNVAAQLSNARWLDHVGPDDAAAKGTVLLVCSTCHSFPSKEVREYIHKTGKLDEAGRKAMWLGTTAWMDSYFKTTFAEEGAARSALAADDPEGIFIRKDDRELLSTFLARVGTPARLDHVDLDALAKVDVLAPEKGTIVTEYQLPFSPKGWPREMLALPGSKDVWGVDKHQNKLFRLTPATGALHWVDVPGHAPGPHTINRDAEGNIWAALEEAEAVARYEPKTGRWERFDFGHLAQEQLLSHDIAFDKDSNVVTDLQGNVWLSIISTNQLVAIDTKTKNAVLHDLPPAKGRSDVSSFLYGVAMSPDRKKVYWSQLRGNLGVFDTTTGKSSVVLELPPHAGPRRLAVDEHNRLWVPLYGTGEIVSIDTRTDKELERYRVPYPSAGIYALAWDRKRQRLWCATVASQSILALEPAAGKWIEYPLPTKEAVFRILSVADDGTVWGSYSERGQLGESRVLERDLIVIGLSPGA